VPGRVSHPLLNTVVNASLNWASIVGIVLAVGGAFLYFMRNFKPALARDYDVFFAAVGLLCGGILFFQGWRLDPILQFGQFLLAGTTVFFAYESVRLRGVTTEQARRSSYFEDEEPAPFRPRGGLGGSAWEGDRERFDEPEPLRRRIPSRDDGAEEDFYRPRRSSRAAIPERAASRRNDSEDWDADARRDRPSGRGDRGPETQGPSSASRYSASGPSRSSEFGARRRDRDAGSEPRRGSRPSPTAEAMPRSSRRGPAPDSAPGSSGIYPGVPQGSPIRGTGSRAESGSKVSDADFSPMGGAEPTQPPSRPPARPSSSRDNSSRFDD
jgi:hypothetical protein